MFNLFKKNDPIAKLEAEYKSMLELVYKLSRTDRAASDQKAAEAEALWQKIEQLKAAKKQS